MPELVERLWADGGHHQMVAGRDRGPFKYKTFVPDAIANLQPVFSSSATSAIESAAAACSRLDASPGIEDLEPVARLLLRAESVASSRIEGLNLSHRRLEEAEFDSDGARGMALSILRNIDAMSQAIEIGGRSGELTEADIPAIHRTLMYTERDRAIAGVVRKEQNWIGGGNTPKRAEFIPPPEDRVEDLLQDLVVFCNRTDLSAIAQAAIAHAQFESIHPFIDGNGRTGRCLIHIILRRRAVSTRVVPPVSVVLAANAPAYVAGLTAFREERLEEWCTLFARAATTAGEKAIDLGLEFKGLRSAWLGHLGKMRKGSTPSLLIEALSRHPIVSVDSIRQSFAVSDEAARKAIERLAHAGIIRQITVGKRNRAWAATEVFDLLDEFDLMVRTPT